MTYSKVGLSIRFAATQPALLGALLLGFSGCKKAAPPAAQRAVPQQDLDNALASVDVGQAGVLSAKARVESVALDLGYCDVRAPVNGLIGAKQVSIGELVGKGQPTLMATISTLDPI